MIAFQTLKQSIGGTFFSVGNLSTGHFSGKLFFEGHFSGHTGSNDTGLEFLSCEGWEKGRSHTDRIKIIYIYSNGNI